MDTENTGGQVSPEDAMRQLIQLRMQLGAAPFNSLAQQMGMPAELLEQIEQSVVELGGPGSGARAGGLVDASGRPIGSTGGLLDASGRPIGGTPALDGLGSAADVAGEDSEEVELDEDASRQMFQELVGVRMLIGSENFGTLAQSMGMPAEASQMVETAAGQVEDEIASRYDNQDEAMTVRLVNARLMMGPDRFTEFAGQVGMPEDVIDQVETIATQLETEGEDGLDDEADDADEAEDEGPSLA